MAKMHKKIALCRPLDQRINDRIRPEENYIACSKLFLVDLLAPILLGTQADTKFSKIVQVTNWKTHLDWLYISLLLKSDE